MFVIEEVEGEIVSQSVIGEEYSLEVIVFVHGEAGGETGQSLAKLDSMFVDRLDFDLLGAPDRAVEPGDRETTFEGGAIFGAAERELLTLIEDDWIEVDFDFFLEVGDETAEIVADLGETETDSLWIRGSDHGLD